MEQSTKPQKINYSQSLIDAADQILTDVIPIDINPAIAPAAPARDIFEVKKRKAWDNSIEARCNFEYLPKFTHRAGVWFFSIWKKSLMGRTLSDIKSDTAEISHFAICVSDFILQFIGNNLNQGNWCICTTPKRRHKINNFATNIAAKIAEALNIPFYEDVAVCHSKQRINAVFSLNNNPLEPNVIVFDDFVTTGSTLKAMKNLLQPLNKNILFICGINNAL